MKLGHTQARFVRMRYDPILDSHGKANIHPGLDITWNHFGLERMCLCIDRPGSSIMPQCINFHLDCPALKDWGWYFGCPENICKDAADAVARLNGLRRIRSDWDALETGISNYSLFSP